MTLRLPDPQLPAQRAEAMTFYEGAFGGALDVSTFADHRVSSNTQGAAVRRNGRPGPTRPQTHAEKRAPRRAHSHSMVPGGLLVMSSTTRLTSRNSLIMREAMRSRRSYGSRAQSAVMASSLVTARITITLP